MDPVFQVSEFIELINQHLSLLGSVVIEGEISRISVKNQQLIFITIKDDTAAIDVFALAYQVKNFGQLEEGMKVHIEGVAGLYKTSGRFRLQANRITPYGAGALDRAFELLKLKLESEGLFDPSHKRPLPKWPQQIGLITAPGSSALEDLVQIAKQRMGGLVLKHLPVAVQGTQSIPSIIKAFEFVNSHSHEFDLIILARGGGSVEDLHAFNTEEVVRAVFGSRCPVISAIGHEDNWTLVDYVSDKRAATPSNAIQIAIADKDEVTAKLSQTIQILKHNIQALIIEENKSVDKTIGNITNSINQTLNLTYMQLDKLPYIKNSLYYQLNLKRHTVQILENKSADKTRNYINQFTYQFHSTYRLLLSLNYENILKRGFSITKKGGQIVRTSAAVTSGDEIHTQLAIGSITSTISRN